MCDLRGVTLPAEKPASETSLEAQLLEEMLAGASLRDAMKMLTHGGAKKNAVYAASLRVKAFLAEEAD